MPTAIVLLAIAAAGALSILAARAPLATSSLAAIRR